MGDNWVSCVTGINPFGSRRWLLGEGHRGAWKAPVLPVTPTWCWLPSSEIPPHTHGSDSCAPCASVGAAHGVNGNHPADCSSFRTTRCFGQPPATHADGALRPPLLCLQGRGLQPLLGIHPPRALPAPCSTEPGTIPDPSREEPLRLPCPVSPPQERQHLLCTLASPVNGPHPALPRIG